MIQLAVIGIIAVVLLGGGATMWHEHTRAVEKAYQAQVDAAQAELSVAAAREVAAAQIKEEEKREAYEKGRAEAKTVARHIEKRGQDYVVQTPVFSNPQCFVPAVGVQLLNSARSNAGLAAVARLSIPELPAPAGNSSNPANSTGGNGGAPAGPLPANAGGRGAVLGVQEQQRSSSGTGQVSGTGAGAHPKPKPIGK